MCRVWFHVRTVFGALAFWCAGSMFAFLALMSDCMGFKATACLLYWCVHVRNFYQKKKEKEG